MTTVRFQTGSPARAEADAIVIGVTPGPRPAAGTEDVDAALAGELAGALAAAGATGEVGQTARLATFGRLTAPTLLAVGLGPEPVSPDALRRASGAAVRALAGTARVATTLATGRDPDAARAVAEGSLAGGYDFLAFRQASLAGRPAPVGSVTLLAPVAPAFEVDEVLARASALDRSISLVRDLVNTPPGDLPPARLAEIATAEATEAGATVDVLDEQALRDGGFGGILGVGQGSARPPRLVRVDWSPPGAGRHVALVGKGITFDSGGLSLKPPGSMEWMKSDMAGAASVLGAVLAAARLQLAVHVTGWLPLAENMPSGSAIRPGDVLCMYGGRRVEVLNTDAEGRLVLADAITRAGEEQPASIVDVATLTGAQIVALGSRVAGLMGNDDPLREQILAAGRRAGEELWPMPLPRHLRAGLDSPIADLKNIGDAKAGGGMLVAGLFLAEFVAPGIAWAHLDIAGPSFNNSEPWGATPKGATGMSVSTLVQWLEDLARG